MEQKRIHWPAVTAVIIAVVAVDQVAKSWLGAARTPTFSHVRNTGLLLGVVPLPAPVLIIWMLTVMVVFLMVIARGAVQLGISPVFPALITGGFVAHVLDRARYGAVRDFLHTPSGLVVDVADIAVLIGIVALVAAVVVRVRSLHASSRYITFDLRNLRAAIVPDEAL